MNIIKGKFELRGKQWEVSVDIQASNIVKATIKSDGVTYCGRVVVTEPGKLNDALGHSFGNMLTAGSITHDEMEQLDIKYRVNSEGIIREMKIGFEELAADYAAGLSTHEYMTVRCERSDTINGGLSAFNELAYGAGFTDDKISFTDIFFEAFADFVETTFGNMCEDAFGESVRLSLWHVDITDDAIVWLAGGAVVEKVMNNSEMKQKFFAVFSEAEGNIDRIVDIAFEKLGARLSKVEE